MSFRLGAIGTLTGSLGKVEFKTSAKGKRWVAFDMKRGRTTLNMRSFVYAVVTGLEMFVQGEEISVFGKLATQTHNDKTYTNFTALKLYEEPQEDTGINVAGEVISVKANEHGLDVWVDTTENEDYPEQVKFQVAKGFVLPFAEGEVISGAKLDARGKYGFWTLDTGNAPEREVPKDFKGKTVRDLSEASYVRETQKDAPASGADFPPETETEPEYSF